VTTSPVSGLPSTAAWRHLDARDGFEVLFPRREPDGYRFSGYATAVEAGAAWGVRFVITVDTSWATRTAHVVGQTVEGELEVRLQGDGRGGWRVDGLPAPHLDGCLDVDLEASAFTNAFPIHRLGLDVGQRADAPAAYLRALDFRVERLEQSYVRLPNDGERRRYNYEAPVFDYRDELVYDGFGLVLEYPGIAERIV
jgi:hypothetical protein